MCVDICRNHTPCHQKKSSTSYWSVISGLNGFIASQTQKKHCETHDILYISLGFRKSLKSFPPQKPCEFFRCPNNEKTHVFRPWITTVPATVPSCEDCGRQGMFGWKLTETKLGGESCAHQPGERATKKQVGKAVEKPWEH